MNKQEIKFNIQKHKAQNKANYKETILFSIASHKGLCTLRKEKKSTTSFQTIYRTPTTTIN